MNFLRQSTAVDIAFGPLIDDDGITPATGLSITQAETRLKKNNGAWAQANDNTTATHEEEGWYEKELDATDTNTVGILIVAVYISGNLACWKEFQVVEEAVYDMFFAASATGIIGTAQTGDAFARLGAPAGASVSADIAAIEAQTDDIGAAGAGLSAIPWNSAWDAEVQSEVADALAVYDPPTNAELVSEINDVQADIAGLTIPSAAAIADAVWDEAIAGHAGAGSTGEALSDAGGAGTPPTPQEIWEYADRQLTALDEDVTTVDLNGTTIGTVTNLTNKGDGSGFTAIPWNAAWDAEVQSEATDALNAYDPPTKAELDVLGTAALATQASVNTIDDLLDTEIPALTTAVADLPTNAELATALGTADDAVLAQIALVKAKTDSLTFTTAGMVDSAVKRVGDTTLTAAGTGGQGYGAA